MYYGLEQTGTPLTKKLGLSVCLVVCVSVSVCVCMCAGEITDKLVH